MVNISKQKLNSKMESRIRAQLVEVFSSQRSKRDIALIIDELLTSSETTMLAKRLVAIIMIHNDCSTYEITKTLNMSVDTVSKWSESLLNGDLKNLEKSFKRKGVRENLLDTVEVFLNVGMPPIAGKGRWSRTFRKIDEVKSKKRW